MGADVAERRLRALRANRVFRADKMRIRPENTVLDKDKQSQGLYSRSSIVRGCAFHPRAIDDRRGRAAVRASLITAVRYMLLGLPCDRKCSFTYAKMFS
jgi:hypothetical protein